MSHFVNVSEFNSEVLGINPNSLSPLDDATNSLFLTQLQEEISEYKEACEQGDFFAQIDALEDLIYFAFGGLYKMGLSAEEEGQIHSEIHAYNMTKVMGVKTERGDFGVPDAIKPSHFDSSEMIRNILAKRG